MAEKPPAWSPSDGTIGQVPIAVTADVDTAGVNSNTASAHALAEQIIRDNAPAINRFVKVQRQQIEIGQETVRRSMLPLDKMEVYYQYVQPFERMHFHISPQFIEPPAVEEQVPELPTPAEPIIPPEVKVPELEVSPIETKPPTLPTPEEEKKIFGKPDFPEIDVPFGLAVIFGNGDEDPSTTKD